jgi:hypothetical protein
MFSFPQTGTDRRRKLKARCAGPSEHEDEDEEHNTYLRQTNNPERGQEKVEYCLKKENRTQ